MSDLVILYFFQLLLQYVTLKAQNYEFIEDSMFSFKSKSATLKDGILDQIGEQIKAVCSNTSLKTVNN